MNKNKNQYTIIFILMCFFISGMLQAQTFEEFKKQREQEFQQYQKENTLAYDEFVRKEKEGFEHYKKEVENYWGKKDAKFSSNKEWVNYSNDKQSRTDIDFENGNASIEILLSPDEAVDSEKVAQKMQAKVQELIFDKCSVYDFAENKEGADQLLNEPVLSGQIADASGQIITDENAWDFIKKTGNPDNINYVEIQKPDGTKSIKATINIPLISDHMLVRATKYRETIMGYATQFNLPRSLVFAIIDTESSFNPMARSYIPAYGLMQIVPKFAGRDAYLHIYKKDTILTSDYLFEPKNNIELGAGYFNKLMTHYFNGVNKSDCRMLCSVAAYNTGSRNFYKAFPEPTKTEIIQRINTMTYEQLLDFLRENLPYSETRNYIVKVDNKIKQYQKWIESNQ